MTDAISPVTATTTVPAAAEAATQQGAGTVADSITGDFETFLTLLTAQLKNQDPLNPADSTEFVAQLASFSSVEQQVQTNEKLDQLITALGDETAAGLADWIGLEVSTAGLAPYDGTPLSLVTEPVKTADIATLVIRDETGAIVGRQTVDPTQSELVWSGEGAAQPLPPGNYSFSVESTTEGGLLIDARDAQLFRDVVEVRAEAGQIQLVLEDGRILSEAAVRALRPAE
ncbi:MAG: flagellar hook capping FlgD N-terminal domain-containing protein [Pseudomonadota bacterium]